MDLFSNYPLMAAICSILFAQFVKFPIAHMKRNKKTSLSIMTSTGGMPSSHSAAVTSLITALVLQNGFDSPYVAIATTFGMIIMFDAMGVRRQCGEQGVLLSRIFDEYTKNNGSVLPDIKLNDEEAIDNLLEEDDSLIIKKYLGHKPSEVLAGAITGIVIAFLLSKFFL